MTKSKSLRDGISLQLALESTCSHHTLVWVLVLWVWKMLTIQAESDALEYPLRRALRADVLSTK